MNLMAYLNLKGNRSSVRRDNHILQFTAHLQAIYWPFIDREKNGSWAEKDCLLGLLRKLMYSKKEIFMMLCFNEEFYLPLLQRVIDKENGTADNLMLGYQSRAGVGEGGAGVLHVQGSQTSPYSHKT